MARLGYNETSLAVAAGLGRTAVNDILKGKSEHPRIDVLTKLCKTLGMSAAEFLDGEVRPPIRVPVIGEITYSDTWRQYNTGKKLPEVLDLWSSNDDLIAVRVVENSMAPRFQRDDVVLGNRVFGSNADNYIGLPCIIKTTDERTLVRIIARSSKPHRYTLRSLDPTAADIDDVEILWFAPIVSIMTRSR
jgi:transcriptional regulator with XRE-family HTH domain